MKRKESDKREVTNKLIATGVLAAILAANCLAWLARPTATPAYPADIFPEQTVQQPAPPAQPKAGNTANAGNASGLQAEEPEPRLTLSLEREPPEIARQAPLTVPAADASPIIAQYLRDRPVARPEVPKIKLFDSEYGTRGVSSRRWVSERVGLEAGVGLTDGETLRERQAAAGVGVVISFD